MIRANVLLAFSLLFFDAKLAIDADGALPEQLLERVRRLDISASGR